MRFLLALLFLFGLAAPAFAAKDRVFTVNVENDVTTPTDRYFTNGVRVGVAFGPASQPGFLQGIADAIPFLSKNYTSRVINLAAGQNIYTPADVSIAALQANDRPYAGWLYAEFGVEVHKPKTTDYFMVQMGVVGPASQAGRTQRAYHRLINAALPQGWGNQLRNEPGLVIAYQRVWNNTFGLGGSGLEFGANPHLGGAVGNIATYAAAGVMLWLGKNLSQTAAPPPRISPSQPGTGYFAHASQVVWYVFAGAEVRAVARDIFLDGNSFRTSPSIGKKNLVGDFQVGFAVIVGGLQITYAQVFRTREFQGQPDGHEYGSLTFSFRF